MSVNTEFRIVKLAAQEMITEFALRELTRRDAEWLMHSVVLNMEAKLASLLLDEVKVEWPADWWQAFRERWFPAWWLRRWPVRYETVRVRANEYLHKKHLQRATESRIALSVFTAGDIPPE